MESENGVDFFLAAALLFALTFLAGAFPILLINLLLSQFCRSKDPHNADNTRKKNCWIRFVESILVKERIVHFLAQISGGVLLYTALIHILPEIREDYKSYLKSRNDTEREEEAHKHAHEHAHSHSHSLPIVDMYACIGFFGIFFVAELVRVLLLTSKHSHHRHGSLQERAKSRSHLPHCLSRHFVQVPYFLQSHTPCPAQAQNQNGSPNGKVDSVNHKQHNGAPSELYPIKSSKVVRYDACGLPSATHMSKDTYQVAPNANLIDLDSMNSANHREGNTLRCSDSPVARTIDCLFIVAALACHAIIDGAFIGANSTGNMWASLTVIFPYKALLAFILSIQIYERSFLTVHNQRHIISEPIRGAHSMLWLFSGLFAVMAPIGILIGTTFASSLQSHKQLPMIIVAAIAAGTLIYIVFLEIIDKLNSRTYISGLAQWIALSTGFGLIPLVSMFFPQK